MTWESDILGSTSSQSHVQTIQVELYSEETLQSRMYGENQKQCCLATTIPYQQETLQIPGTLNLFNQQAKERMTSEGKNYCKMEWTDMTLVACYLCNNEMESHKMQCKLRMCISEEEAMNLTQKMLLHICIEVVQGTKAYNGVEKLPWIMLAECVRYAVQDWKIVVLEASR